MKETADVVSPHVCGVLKPLVLTLVLLLNGCNGPVPPAEKMDSNKPLVSLFDLEGKSINPFQPVSNEKPTVFFFVSTDCPISNRYAPEIQRLAGEFSTNGVNSWLVYPDPD